MKSDGQHDIRAWHWWLQAVILRGISHSYRAADAALCSATYFCTNSEKALANTLRALSERLIIHKKFVDGEGVRRQRCIRADENHRWRRRIAA